MGKRKSICPKDEEEKNQVSQSNQHANQQQTVNEQTKKIKKLGPGRPQRERVIHQYDQYLISQLEDKWFGNEISSDLVIYLSQQGSLTIKAKTGPRRSMAAELTTVQKSRIKQFRQKFRKELQKKIQIILKYLNYSSDRTFLLLLSQDNKQNKQPQDQLTLDYDQFQHFRCMNNILKLLDQSFIPSFILIVQMLIKYKNQDEFTKIWNIINLLKADKQKHEMLFGLQLIQNQIDPDLQILNNMEDLMIAEDYRISQYRVPQIDFNTENGKNLIESVYDQSRELYNFIKGIMNIINKYY